MSSRCSFRRVASEADDLENADEYNSYDHRHSQDRESAHFDSDSDSGSIRSAGTGPSMRGTPAPPRYAIKAIEPIEHRHDGGIGRRYEKKSHRLRAQGNQIDGQNVLIYTDPRPPSTLDDTVNSNPGSSRIMSDWLCPALGQAQAAQDSKAVDVDLVYSFEQSHLPQKYRATEGEQSSKASNVTAQILAIDHGRLINYTTAGAQSEPPRSGPSSKGNNMSSKYAASSPSPEARNAPPSPPSPPSRSTNLIAAPKQVSVEPMTITSMYPPTSCQRFLVSFVVEGSSVQRAIALDDSMSVQTVFDVVGRKVQRILLDKAIAELGFGVNGGMVVVDVDDQDGWQFVLNKVKGESLSAIDGTVMVQE
ncbi:hypothetical protein CLAFUW4_11015 [Fulvia fulva]|nr:hypothetical protein CLAFUR4_11020 [Fulvia fulva]KAK4621085.1 hypothetical protein CLAFUR0_11027 [Fulvia fulva]WPV17053.1 hypothetical protein CLAFUW4_11015 [Fulvia fulva]WPV32056.1 hypothetical protein CLAFUW7_11013 [Fulvia fulva]